METGAHDGTSENSDTSDVIKSLSQKFSPEALQSALKLAVAMKNASQEECDSLMRSTSQPNEALDSEEKPSLEVDRCDNDNGLEKLQQLSELLDPVDEVRKVEEDNSEGDSVVINGLGEGKDNHIADENAATDDNSYETEGRSVFTTKDDQRFSEVADEKDKIEDQIRFEDDGNIGDCVTAVAIDDVNALLDGKEDCKNDCVTNENSAHQLRETTSNSCVNSVDKSIVTPIGEQMSEFPYNDERFAITSNTAHENSESSSTGCASSSEDEELPELLQGKAEDSFSEIEDVDGKEPVGVVSVESETTEASVLEGTLSMYHASSVPQSEAVEYDKSKEDYAESSSSSDEDEMVSSTHSVVASSESDLSEAVVPSGSLANQSEKLKGNAKQLVEETQPSLLMTGFKDDEVAVKDDEMIPEDVSKEPPYVTAPILERMSSLSSTGTQTSLENLSLVKDPILSTHGNLDSILNGKEHHTSKLPFYYQPQIVMHEEKPVLVLQPVPSSTSSSNGDASVPGLESSAFNASLPIILPLASPSIDKKTKEALFQRMSQGGTFLVDKDDVEEGDANEKNYLSGLLSRAISIISQPNGKESGEHLLDSKGHDKPTIKIPAAEKYSEHQDGGKSEGLPEWVASSELDKAFSAAAERMSPTTEQQSPAILASPSVSFPSTNPFAKDLVVQKSGHYDVEADSSLNPGMGEPPLYSLFGPPSSPTVLQGARPKEFRAYQDPGIGDSGTNPFTPDPPKSTKQRRRHEQKSPSSAEVVVAAEVHSSEGHPGEINGVSHRSPRRRLSSESMVTLIETSYPDTSADYVEPPGIDETSRATKNPQLQQERNENSHVVQKPQKTLQESGEIHSDTKKVKPKTKVPGKVAPFWIPDFACTKCTGCKVKFTLFIRKHHCRGCGKIFCNTCCSQLARFPYLEFKIGRVCKSCTKAIKEATQLKSKEDASKQEQLQQQSDSPASIQYPKGLSQRNVVTNANGQGNSPLLPHSSVLPAGVVAANTQPQRNSLPLAQGPRTATTSSGLVPVNQGLQGSVSSQSLPYQPLTWPPESSGRVQYNTTPSQPVVPSNNHLQGSQSHTRPAQPAKQYMWVPASQVQQPAVPVVYMNPVAPNLQGGPMLMTYPPGQQFIPQQAPVMLLANQPSSTSSLVRTTEAPKTSSDSLKGTVPVSNRSPSGTVTTFSVLPQHVGQNAVLSAQGYNTGTVKTTTTTTPTTAATINNQVSSNSSSAPSSQIQPPSSQSLQKTIPEPGEEALTTNHSLPSTSALDHTPSHAITTTSPSLRVSSSVMSSSSGDHQSQESLSRIQRSRQSDGSVLVTDETDPSTKENNLPFRRAGRTITWRHRTQGKSKLQEQKKSLAKDLRDLTDGITVQTTADLLVHVKKMKLKEGNKVITVWCYQSEGLTKFNHLEVVVLLEIRKKEEIFPEEVLRVYRGILHLASKLDYRFYHCNYLSSNNQFLDSPDDAGFILVSSELKPKPMGLKGITTPFLYGILVKRSELSAAMFTPSRLLLRLGNQMNSYPFPVWNNRDRRPIFLGNEHDDRFFHTVFAMNKYLKNGVPEAMIPGLYVIKEGNKIVLQIPKSGQSAVVGLLDRLIKKEDQTATVPLLADIPPYLDNCKVVVCGENGKKTVKSFGNTNNTSVVGLSFVLLHLGVDASSPLNFGGELLDDGVLIFFSKAHTLKLRQSLQGKTNCYFFLGDKFDIAHFELRWMADVNYHVLPSPSQNSEHYPMRTTTEDTTPKEPGTASFPGHATINVQYSGFGDEVELLRKVFDDYGKILRVLEGDIRQACTEPLMKHSKKMKAGDTEELQLRVVLKPSYKKWSVGPSNLPTALIRSLQMVLHTVKVPMVFEGELVMSFYVSVLKQ